MRINTQSGGGGGVKKVFGDRGGLGMLLSGLYRLGRSGVSYKG